MYIYIYTYIYMFEGAVQTFWPNFRCFHWCNEENVRTIWLLIFALPPCLQPFSPSKFDTEKEDGSTNTVVVTLVRCRLRCKHLVLDVRHLWTIFQSQNSISVSTPGKVPGMDTCTCHLGSLQPKPGKPQWLLFHMFQMLIPSGRLDHDGHWLKQTQGGFTKVLPGIELIWNSDELIKPGGQRCLRTGVLQWAGFSFRFKLTWKFIVEMGDSRKTRMKPWRLFSKRQL